MSNRYKLYTVLTSKSLDDLHTILLGKAPSNRDIGPLREAFMREKVSGRYRKTNRKFVLTTDDVYSGMKSSGYCDPENKDLYISEYEIRDSDRAPSDSVMHYYYPHSEDTLLDMITKLDFLSKMGLFDKTDYLVHGGLVEFKDSVPNDIRVVVKILVDTVNCRVSWYKIKSFSKIVKVFQSESIASHEKEDINIHHERNERNERNERQQGYISTKVVSFENDGRRKRVIK